MSIGLHVWIMHQPKRCVHFIAVHRPLRLAHTSAHAVHLFYCIISAHTVPRYGPIHTHCNFLLYRPIQSLGMGPYILIAISYYIGQYSPSVWAHTYSLQFLLQSAEIRWLDVIGHLYMSGLTVLSVGYD